MASRQASSKKKTTARRSTGGRSGTHKKPAPKSHINVVWSIPTFGAGLLLCAMLFVRGSGFWSITRQALFGVFGIGMYLLPLILIYIALLIAVRNPINRPVGKAVLLEVVWCAIPVVFSKQALAGLNLIQLVQTLFAGGKTTWWSGGVFGILAGGSLVSLCGRPAANIILIIALLIVAMILLTITPADMVDFLRGLRATEETGPLAKEEYDPQDEWEMRHADATARRTQARGEAAQRRRRQMEEREAARAAYAKKLQAQFDVDLGPDKLPEQPEKRDPFPDLPLPQPKPEPQKELPYARPPKPESYDMGSGLSFGMKMYGPKIKEEPMEVSIPQPEPPVTAVPEEPVPLEEPASVPVSVQEPEIEPEEEIFTAIPLTPPEEPVKTASMAEMVQAQGGMLPVDPELETLIQKAVDAPALAEARASQLPTPNLPSHDYRYPPLELFEEAQEVDDSRAVQEMKTNADILVNTLDSFGVKTRILDICRGPSVTRYELQPQAGVKISRITSLADDIALNLAAAGVRIEAPIPGKPAVGIEVPNKIKTPVGIRGLLESQNYTKSASPLTMALGRDIAGSAQVADLCKMPHLLIAGSTGSGKSVCVNSILISFLYKSSPDDIKLILIDPKVVELAEYNGIPHLLMPVVTEPKKASGALGAAVAEMERRYKMFAENNVRDIKSFNRKASTGTELEKMPYIAIVIDELADLMMVSGKEVEDYICRIAQKARAAGMHLIVATQRPSVDVVTGLIKANIPSRIAFAVSSQVDSRTILDGSGAEKLLGMGDMLFMPIGANKPVRVQGAYVKDEEIEACLNFIKQSGRANYDEAMMSEVERLAAQSGNGKGGSSSSGEDAGMGDDHDPMFEQAVEAVIEAGMASTSLLQRRCKLGYARAARIMDEMEQEGVIGPFEGAKPRKVLLTKQQWQERKLMADNNPVQADMPF